MGNEQSGDRGQLVQVEQLDGATWLTMDSPSNRNALSRRLVRELVAGLRGASAQGARLVVLTATGNTFCSGADLDERLHPPGRDQDNVTLVELLTAMARAPMPVVARVNGHVRAGGMGLVAASDLAVAPESASFAFTEVLVGVAPALIAVPALRRMAARPLERFMLTGQTFSAKEAQAAGLLTIACADLEEADAWIAAILGSLRRAAPKAVHATKALLSDLRSCGWDEALLEAEGRSDEMFASEEAAEGMSAFLEKRAPRWSKTSESKSS